MTTLRQGLSLGKKGVISLVGAGGKTSLMFRLAREFAASKETVLTTTTTKIMPPTEEQSKYLILSNSASEILSRSKNLLKHSSHITAAANQLIPQDKLVGFPPETVELFLKSNLFRWIIVEADGAAGRPLKAPAPHEPVIPMCTNWVIGIVGLSALGNFLDEHTVFRFELVSKISGLAKGMRIIDRTLCDILTHKHGIFKGTPIHAKKIAFLNQADIPGKAKAGRAIIQYLIREKNIDLSRVVLGSTLLDPVICESRNLHRESTIAFEPKYLNGD